ncbi:MAG: sigma-54-dependent Fis family transcriptional regulator [Planctomycetes bacterium]|nr:sigma-54-dependent Fis family transcriptional regulator [Planctomycetota bacterium]
MARKVLIADDDGLSREFMAEALRAAGHEVLEAETGKRACQLFEREQPQLVFTDLRMPEGDGLRVLETVKKLAPEVPVVLVTAFGTVETAVQAMRTGAEDFIMKPVTIEQIDLVLERLADRAQLLRENKVLKAQIAAGRGQEDCVGISSPWRRCLALAERVARTRATVLIRGESGAGKEVVADRIHRSSDRANGPYIRTNCAVLQDSLLTSELFGHEKGAFTGAYARKEGRFELADGGTLFLDEIGEISPEIQAKLLRVLESGEFERVGGKETVKVDVRVICATNRDLEQMIREGSFREDLFYRLNVVPVLVPALRERREDVPALAEHFLRRFAREYGSPARAFSASTIETMKAHDWPGNVRELANMVQRQVLLANDEIIDEVQLGIGGGVVPAGVQALDEVGQSIAEMERRLILGTLRKTGGNKTEASKILGVTARTLSNKLRLYRERGELPGAVGV